MLRKSLATLLTSTLLCSPAYAWHTLTPSIQSYLSMGDPHPVCIIEAILDDYNPAGVLLSSLHYPVYACNGSGPVNFGPIPESGDCLRTLTVAIQAEAHHGVLTREIRTVTAPAKYNACLNTGIQVSGWNWSLNNIPVIFTYLPTP